MLNAQTVGHLGGWEMAAVCFSLGIACWECWQASLSYVYESPLLQKLTSGSASGRYDEQFILAIQSPETAAQWDTSEGASCYTYTGI